MRERVEEDLRPVGELPGVEPLVGLEVEHGRQLRAAHRLQAVGERVRLLRGVHRGPGLVVAADEHPGGARLGDVVLVVPVGRPGALGGLDEGEGLSGRGGGVPVDPGAVRVLPAGGVEALREAVVDGGERHLGVGAGGDDDDEEADRESCCRGQGDEESGEEGASG